MPKIKKETKKQAINANKDGKQTTYKKGLKTPTVSTGPINPTKVNTAKRLSRQALVSNNTGGGGARTAGMMMNNFPMAGTAAYSTSSLAAYHTSYANGLNWIGGTRDIPPYFVAMNEQNGGILYWPMTLREKYEIYRYFSRTDSYCGRAMELLTDLPMSKISLNMPKMEDQPKELKEEILSCYEGMCDELGLFEQLQSILWEYNEIGNCFIFSEWSDERKLWEKLIILPPEEISIFHFPGNDKKSRVEWRPERLMSIIKQYKDGGGVGINQEDELQKDIFDNIPKEMIDMLTEHDCIRLDTDPYSGSFVHHLARRRAPYQDLGVSVLERVYVPMLMKEHYRYTQLGLASRNMTPKNKISADKLNSNELADLRAQVDLSYLDPEFSIVTNYEWNWETIGATGRLLDLGSEYETIENQIFAGLGVTRELLTGEGVYSGTKITVEILNTMFLLTRMVLQNYVEKQLFRPVAEAHGWYKTDKHGMKKYFYPTLGFNRLSIRDNQEVFDSLFQLYQKGSLPVDIIYELFNLNTDEIHDRIYSDLLTVKDPTFNRVMEEVGTEIGRQLVEKTDVLPRVCKYLRLHKVDEKGNVLEDTLSDSQVLTPEEQELKNRAMNKERKRIFTQPEMKEINFQDIDEMANAIVENVDPNISPEELKNTINKSIEEVLK